MCNATTPPLSSGAVCRDVEPAWPASLLGFALCLGRVRAGIQQGDLPPELSQVADAAVALLIARGPLAAVADWPGASDGRARIFARFIFPVDRGREVRTCFVVERETDAGRALVASGVPWTDQHTESTRGREAGFSAGERKKLWKRFARTPERAAIYLRAVLAVAGVEPDAPAVDVFPLPPKGKLAPRPLPPPTPETTERARRRRRFAELRDLASALGGVRVERGEAAPCAICGGVGRRFGDYRLSVGSVVLCTGCAHGVDARTPERLRQATRADQRARWDERGGPAEKWPTNNLSLYIGTGWFD